jgi:hypothetical protein
LRFYEAFYACFLSILICLSRSLMRFCLFFEMVFVVFFTQKSIGVALFYFPFLSFRDFLGLLEPRGIGGHNGVKIRPAW